MARFAAAHAEARTFSAGDRIERPHRHDVHRFGISRDCSFRGLILSTRGGRVGRYSSLSRSAWVNGNSLLKRR